jgi:rhodanese-related sulfurtransferase
MLTKIKEIDRDALVALLVSGEGIQLVDVLARSSFIKEHIKGAISLPATEIEEKADLLLKREKTVVVYCASFECQASTSAAKKLIELGFTKVIDYKGGLKDYKRAGLPLEGELHPKDKAVPSCGCA